MPARRRVALGLVPMGLLALCLALFCGRDVEIRTSLDDLIGASGRMIPSAIRSRSSGLVPVILSASDRAAAASAADALYAALTESSAEREAVVAYCREIRYRFEGDEVEKTMAFCRSHRAGLVSAAARSQLQTREGRELLAKKAIRRYVASPVPPLFPPAEDPFCLLDGFVTSLPTSCAGWRPNGGLLTAERDDAVHVLMLLELKREVVDDIDRLIGFQQALEAAVAAVRTDSSTRISACGAPLHAALTAASCKREIGMLTWFSATFIVLLSIVVFRSVRWVPLLAMSLVVSILAGSAALLSVFGGFHLMTLVMGTTVLGLVVDYSFHWLMHPASARRETERNLFLSFVTTEVSLVPMMLSTVPVLRQSAVFLGVGLAAALAYVLFCYPLPEAERESAESSGPFVGLRPILVVLFVIAAIGMFSVRFGTNLESVYRSPASLRAPERLFAELNGGDGGSGFVVTEGGDLEDRLTRESRLDLPESVPRLSRFLPPLSLRQSISADVRRLYEEQGERVRRALGLAALEIPEEPTAWVSEEIPVELRRSFVADNSLVIASAPEPRQLPADVTFCRPRTLVAEVLSAWTDETRTRLLAALVLMFIVLAWFCRKRAFVIFAPSLLALAAVAGGLGLAGVQIGLFHLLAGFLLAGMSVDYTVFLHSGKSLRPALCSLLTSLVGFGALAMVSFPVVSSFGVVLGLGLPIAFAAALATTPRGKSVEKGASPLGLEILWCFYRAFGLKALHFAAGAVGVCIWMCSGSVRRSSPSVRKVVNFTRSLADKLVVMAGGRDLPRVATDGSRDAEEFLADVHGGRGVFVLSSHCGTIEVLVALGESEVMFHAWMDVDRTSVFSRFYLRHAHRPRVVIHPISEIGMGTAFFAGEALDRGDCLVMAGDRGRGAFRFAHALAHPTYFVACVRKGDGYQAVVRRLPETTEAMERRYSEILQETASSFPDQSFEWNK